jgi:hypothetical protein
MKLFVTALALTLSVAAHAQNIDPAPPTAVPTYAALVAMKVPVIAGDITDRPYRVVGEIEAGVRKATIFSKDPSEAKVYRELWERGRKLGADAVINANYGDPRVTALSWGSRKAKGQAIKFLTDAEIAARAATPAQ